MILNNGITNKNNIKELTIGMYNSLYKFVLLSNKYEKIKR